MRVLTATQMREADRIAIEEYNISGMDLMERAGEEAFREALIMLAESDQGKRGAEKNGLVAVLCGSGNNGGDGYVIARKLLEQKRPAAVLALTDPGKLKGDARTAYDRFVSAGGKLAHDGGPGAVRKLEQVLGQCCLVVDAVLGTGIDRPVKDELCGIIDLVNSSGKPVLAVDIPSGVGGDDGKVYGVAVKATKTVTFQAAKTGCTTEPGASRCGELIVADIGIPNKIIDDLQFDIFKV